MRPQASLPVVAAGILVCALVAHPVGSLAQDSSAKPAPVVIVAPVKDQDITQTAKYVGRVEAIQQANIQARVEGYIDKVDFREGADVKTGDLLFSLDKGTYQAALAGAQAELLNAQASEAGAKAALKASDLTLERNTTLLKSNTVSQAAVDKAQAVRDEDAAKVQSADAQIAQAKADIESAQLNLSYTDIKSPIDGRIGKADFTKGNLVNTSSGTLATVIQMNPIRIVFSVSDRDYIDVIEQTKEMPDEAVKSEFVPTIVLPNGKPYGHPGTISFIDNTVDASTGTIAIRADFDNPNDILVAGQFVSVTVKIGKTEKKPVVPSAAVLEDKDGSYVLTLDKDDRTQIRRVKLGKTVGANVVVTSGVVQGDTIIVEGLQRVKSGMVVTPQPAKAQSDEPQADTSDTSEKGS